MLELSDGSRYMGGLYEGMVRSDEDPLSQGRVRVQVYALHDDDTAPRSLPWAKACFNRSGNDSGDKRVPNKGQRVWVMFEKGDIDYPVWVGSFLESGDTLSGSREERIDGNDVLEVKGDQEVTIDGDRETTLNQGDVLTVNQKAAYEYEDLEVIVLDGVAYTYGTRAVTVEGEDSQSIQGTQILRVLGHQRLTVAESLATQVGGDEKRLVIGSMVVKAANALGSPTSDAMLYETLNGNLRLSSKSIAGIEGAGLFLDALGKSSLLASLINLTIEAKVLLSLESAITKIGPKGTAIVPVCTQPHTHLVMGMPTLVATPGPGVPTTVLGPAI